LTWGPELTDEDFEKYRNRNRRTDDGACALSLLLIPELLGYVVIEQSSTGDGVDYYLRRVDDDSDLIFNTDGTAKLEVSGIHKRTSTNNPRSRINTKIKRIEKVRSKDPAGTTRNDTVICIVEFGDPAAVAEIV
jgi:hypothetical protein